jgi:outer membrane protein assembly factor BamB
MKKLLTVAAALVAAAAVAPLSAQDPTRLYSDPALPAQEALDRLRLKTAWTAMVPTAGRRDGLFSVQVVPRGTGHELLVQTRSGTVTALDAATGQARWATRVGEPYRVAQPVAYNRASVFVINNIVLYALDRATGRLQWQFEMPGGATAAPVADDEQVYVALSNGRFVAYALPNLALYEKLAAAKKGTAAGGTSSLEASRVLKGIDVPAIGPLSGAREAYRAPPQGPQPAEQFSYLLEDRVDQTPLLAQDRILLPGTGGQILGLPKTAARLAWPAVRTRGKILVPAGQHDETAYVASTDFNVYAVSITGGRVFWRYASGGTPTERPAATDEDVYVAVDRSGLMRLDRAGGDEMWRNEDGARFLSANAKFVYAADRHGRLLVLDRARGTTLSTYAGTRDYVFPIQNDWTDRLYLAANNGLIVCLHDRAYEKPAVMKKVQERTPPPPPGGGKPGPKEPPKDMGDGGKPPDKPAGMDKKP